MLHKIDLISDFYDFKNLKYDLDLLFFVKPLTVYDKEYDALGFYENHLLFLGRLELRFWKYSLTI